MNLKKEKETALQAAINAGRILLHYYGRKEAVKEKRNKSLVAEADLGANKAIISTIKKYFPSHSILSEETGLEGNRSGYKWIIDPLDGTHNFLRGIPIFGVSIALKNKNEVIIGVLHFPLLRITAVAEKGKGAFVNGKKINVSGKKSLDYAYLNVEFSSSSRSKVASLLSRLRNKPVDVRNFGSAAYDLLLVASGKSEAYIIFTTNEWDVAAGILLVEEAGGKVTDLNGKVYDLRSRNYIVSNGRMHNLLLRLLK